MRRQRSLGADVPGAATSPRRDRGLRGRVGLGDVPTAMISHWSDRRRHGVGSPVQEANNPDGFHFFDTDGPRGQPLPLSAGHP